MHQAFYRKYRPQIFGDVYGQDHITSVLKYECATDSVSHAYLFCGSRGTGKTSCAKILAKAINCEAPVNGDPCGKCAACRAIDEGSATDVVEMDAASNNGVDNIRELRDEVVYTPSMLKKRVYIIDEVHMLTQSAFNALLKTLEEPPEYVVFILATTELHKLPATITSRCQRFDFRRITVEALCARLEYIANAEGITLTRDAAARIARIAEGGMRDAISLFELCAGGGAEVNADRVAEVLGLSGYDTFRKFAFAVADGDVGTLLTMIAETQSSSKDVAVFWNELTSFWRDMMIMKVSPDPTTYLDLTEAEYSALYDAASRFTMNQLALHARIMDDARQDMARSPQSRRQTAEFAALRLASPTMDQSPDALLARISALEEKVAFLEMGVVPAPKANDEDVKTVTAETAPTVPAEELEPQSVETDDEFTAIPDPTELIDRLGVGSEMYHSHLSRALIETDRTGERLRISVDGSFARSFLDTPRAKEMIARAAMLAKLVSAQPSVEIVEKKKPEEKPDDLFGF